MENQKSNILKFKMEEIIKIALGIALGLTLTETIEAITEKIIKK